MPVACRQHRSHQRDGRPGAHAIDQVFCERLCGDSAGCIQGRSWSSASWRPLPEASFDCLIAASFPAQSRSVMFRAEQHTWPRGYSARSSSPCRTGIRFHEYQSVSTLMTIMGGTGRSIMLKTGANESSRAASEIGGAAQEMPPASVPRSGDDGSASGHCGFR
jgi:hypothetical protein